MSDFLLNHLKSLRSISLQQAHGYCFSIFYIDSDFPFSGLVLSLCFQCAVLLSTTRTKILNLKIDTLTNHLKLMDIRFQSPLSYPESKLGLKRHYAPWCETLTSLDSIDHKLEKVVTQVTAHASFDYFKFIVLSSVSCSQEGNTSCIIIICT